MITSALRSGLKRPASRKRSSPPIESSVRTSPATAFLWATVSAATVRHVLRSHLAHAVAASVIDECEPARDVNRPGGVLEQGEVGACGSERRESVECGPDRDRVVVGVGAV